MAQNKRQHYVPVFYLKYFSSDKEKRRISLYNLDLQKLIPDISIKDQAYKENFYGADLQIESGLEQIEKRSSEVLSGMIANNSHPKYYSKEHHVIITFTALLHARTLSFAEEMNETFNSLSKQKLSKDPRFQAHLDKIKINLNNPSQLAVSHITSSIHLVFDLGYKLLINKTPIPFVTSDNPVVFYNQFFEVRKGSGNKTGLASRGLQVFIPISPEHTIIFYDQSIYNVSGIRHNPIYLNNSNDVSILNGLQYLNARTNLYFNQSITDVYIRSFITKFSSYRKIVDSNIKYNLVDKKQYQSFNYPFREDIQCQLSLPFIKFSKKAKSFELNNITSYFRDYRLVLLHEEFKALVDKGIYNTNDFQKFIKDKELKNSFSISSLTQ